jgi:hypothetical protein
MERWIQSCRHELLDRMLIWDQAQLLHALHEYERHHNAHRPHRGISNARPLHPLPDRSPIQTRSHTSTSADVTAWAASCTSMNMLHDLHGRLIRHPQQQWLTETQALAQATGSAQDQAHATVGFGQLAWLRGDHDDAARLMEERLPTLRRLGDQRCTGRALYLLGQRSHEQRQPDRAEQQLAASVQAIVLAGESFVLVDALEALAAVHADQGRFRHAATLLGTAHTSRASASAHMRPLHPPDGQLRRSLVHALAAAFDTAHTEGQRLAPTQAL